MLSVVRPKGPTTPQWREVQHDLKNGGYANKTYIHNRLGLVVITAVEVPEGEPEYHLSISKIGKSGAKRCSKEEARLVIKQFGLEGAKEDNHSSLIRSFWRPVAEVDVGVECECKGDEVAIVEGDFEWRPLTNANYERGKTMMETGVI